jgi:hypothetical protein
MFNRKYFAGKYFPQAYFPPIHRAYFPEKYFATNYYPSRYFASQARVHPVRGNSKREVIPAPRLVPRRALNVLVRARRR